MELVDAPNATSYETGLFSTIAFRDNSDGRWQHGMQWWGTQCGPLPDPVGDPCEDDIEKTLERGAGSVAEAKPFTVYGTFICAPVGVSAGEAQERAETRLRQREEAAVEAYVWTMFAGDYDSLSDQDSWVDAVARLERYIGETYGAVGVIHMSRANAVRAIAASAVERSSGSLRTRLGTPVAAGSGYGGDHVYASPRLFGYQSDVFTSSDRDGDLMDRRQNMLYAVAERTYAIGWDDCGVGRIKAPAYASGGGGGSGADLEFDWDGTRLGVRQEGDDDYEYVDLQGERGQRGEKGTGEEGPQGPAGKDGFPTESQWDELEGRVSELEGEDE